MVSKVALERLQAIVFPPHESKTAAWAHILVRHLKADSSWAIHYVPMGYMNCSDGLSIREQPHL